MIGHAMKYHGMTERVLAELPKTTSADIDDAQFGKYLNTFAQLRLIQRELVGAENRLVEAYRMWRTALESAAELGSERAAEYLKRTTWDLT